MLHVASFTVSVVHSVSPGDPQTLLLVTVTQTECEPVDRDDVGIVTLGEFVPIFAPSSVHW
jgi:hypothetical protein